MGKKLNLETFNNILLEAGINKRELLVAELQTAYAHKIQLMETMVARANAGEEFDEILKCINNVDHSLDLLGAQLDELEKEEAEHAE